MNDTAETELNYSLSQNKMSLRGMIAFLTLIALMNSLLQLCGISEGYYLSSTANAVRRFGFALAFAASIMSISSFFIYPRRVDQWLGLQVFVLLSAIAAIYFMNPLDNSGDTPELPIVWESLFSTTLGWNICLCLLAVAVTRPGGMLIFLLLITSIAEFRIALELLVIGRQPEWYFQIYISTSQISPWLMTVALAYSFVCWRIFNCGFWGWLASVILISVSLIDDLYHAYFVAG